MTARVSNKGTFVLPTLKLKVGKNKVRVWRPKVNGHKAVASKTFTI